MWEELRVGVAGGGGVGGRRSGDDDLVADGGDFKLREKGGCPGVGGVDDFVGS
jgi:hypothetical protein